MTCVLGPGWLQVGPRRWKTWNKLNKCSFIVSRISEGTFGSFLLRGVSKSSPKLFKMQVFEPKSMKMEDFSPNGAENSGQTKA
jgi:hypothetical protein